jgi:hypothetical protein
MINKDLIISLRKSSLLMLLLLEIFIGWQNLQYIKGAEYNASEPVAEWESRFVRLKKIFPLTRGTVGYISDPDVAGYAYGPDDDLEFLLTQYTVAPIIIKKGANFEWNIGILSRPVYEDWARLNSDKFEATFLKYNIYLIHRLNK